MASSEMVSELYEFTDQDESMENFSISQTHS